ncbi:MAG: hypothetical protein OHK0019_37610 [Saprospiraceae bacterium]
MSSIKINLTEKQVEALRKRAAYSNLTVEQLIEKYLEKMVESKESDEVAEDVEKYVPTPKIDLTRHLERIMQEDDELLQKLA